MSAKAKDVELKTEDVKTEVIVDTGVPIVCNINGLNVSTECKIEVVANPKRPGSKAHQRYEAYAKAHTIGEYLDRGGLKADLRYDHSHKFLTLLEIVKEGKVELATNKTS